MKRMKYLVSFLLLLTVVITSCKKEFLELTPSYAIDSETALKDSSKLEAFITGIYDIKDYFYYIGHAVMSSDARGGDVVVRNYSNYGRFVPDYQYNIVDNYYMPNRVWRYAYKTITACQLVIDAMADAPFAEDYKNQVMAEARALRAYSYYYLRSFFAHPYSVNPAGPGVPVLDGVVGPEDEFPARATVQAVYDKMVEDLTFADQYLTNRNDAHGIFRVTPNFVDGLLARVYLEMENWGMAATHAVAARNGFAITPAGDLAAGFVDPTSGWLFSLTHSADDNNGYLLVPSFYDPNDAGYSSFKASQDFVALYEGGDARLAYFGTLEQPADAYKVNKFLFRSEWDLDLCLMRVAEMYLIEAEAEAEAGNTANAIAALNAVQSRVGATLTTGLTGQALVDAILVERRKELFGEGFASYDLQRRNLPLNRTGVGHWDPKTLPANDWQFLYPIPVAETDANDNVKQNEGYY